MWVVERLRELWDWLLALPPDFAFLLSLPFIVALAGALAGRGRAAARADPSRVRAGSSLGKDQASR